MFVSSYPYQLGTKAFYADSAIAPEDERGGVLGESGRTPLDAFLEWPP